jgi:hypothetical protein
MRVTQYLQKGTIQVKPSQNNGVQTALITEPANVRFIQIPFYQQIEEWDSKHKLALSTGDP